MQPVTSIVAEAASWVTSIPSFRKRLDHDPGILAVERTGEPALPLGQRGDDQGPIGQALRARHANARAARRRGERRERDLGGVVGHASRRGGGCQGEGRFGVLSSSGVMRSMRRRFSRDVSPVSRLISDRLSWRTSASISTIAALASPLSGAAVTDTRSRPARSPRIASLFALGCALTPRTVPRGWSESAIMVRRPRRGPTRPGRASRLPGSPPRNRPTSPSKGAGSARPIAPTSSSRSPRSRAKYGRAASPSAPSGAIVIRPTTGMCRTPATADESESSPSAVQPCFDGSDDVLTWRQTPGGSTRPRVSDNSSSASSSLSESTPWIIRTRGKRAPCLVALEVPDVMPADGQVGQRLGLRPELLGIVLTEVLLSPFDEGPDRVDRRPFRDRDERYVAGRPPALGGGPDDPVADGEDVLDESRRVQRAHKESSCVNHQSRPVASAGEPFTHFGDRATSRRRR